MHDLVRPSLLARIALFVALAALCLCPVASARAQSGIAVVRLDLQRDAVPRYLCASASSIAEHPQQLALNTSRGEVVLDGSLAITDPPEGAQPRMRTLQSILERPRRGICQDAEYCAPRVSFASAPLLARSVTCVANDVADAGMDTMLFLDVHGASADTPIALEQVRLEGPSIFLTTRASTGRDVTLTVRVAGGDYLAGGSAVPARASVPTPLELTPRCSTHEVPIPPLVDTFRDTESGAVSRRGRLIVRDGERVLCEDDLGDRLVMLLPSRVELPGREYEIRAFMATGSPLVADPHFVLDAAWRGLGSELVVRARTITFGWQRACEYPKSEPCPRAQLSTLGACVELPSVQETCFYECTSSSGPVLSEVGDYTATFEAPRSRLTWQRQFAAAGEVLSGYTAPELPRAIILSFPDWPDPPAERARRMGDELETLVLRHRGSTEPTIVRVPVAGIEGDPGTHRVTLPYAFCSDQVEYWFEGRRLRDSRFAPIGQGGTLAIDDPGEQPGRPNREVFFGMHAMIGVQINGDARASPVSGEVGFSVRYHPGGAGWFNAQLSLAYMLSNVSYRVLDAGPEQVLANRFILGFSVWSAIGPLFSAGVGLALAVGVPMSKDDSVLVGDVWSALYPTLGLRIQITPNLSVEVRGGPWLERISRTASDRMIDGAIELGGALQGGVLGSL